MSEHHSGPAETGAPMNYNEHEKTYDLFIAATKYSTVFLVALLIAMAAGFFAGAGFFGGLIVLIVLTFAGIFLLR
ncbi:aa3-type cytochrome c oxidase subunit IV [Rhizobium arsenicireducens]|jgi:ABC-type multidrug transport system permease subunit